MLKYHTLEGRIKTDAMVGDQTLRTGIDARVKVGVYHNVSLKVKVGLLGYRLRQYQFFLGSHHYI